MFVGGLDPSIRKAELFNFFKKFGKVVKAKIVGEAKGRSRGFGFVHFASKEIRKRVCMLKGLEINGREIDCKVANSDLSKPVEEEEEDPERIAKIFIKDVPLFVKKSEIQDHYSRFGRIKEVLLIVRPNKNRAFSYVKFFDHRDAYRAVQGPQEIRRDVFLVGVLALPKNSKKLQQLHRNYAKYAYNIDYEFGKSNDVLNVIFLFLIRNFPKQKFLKFFLRLKIILL